MLAQTPASGYPVAGIAIGLAAGRSRVGTLNCAASATSLASFSGSELPKFEKPVLSRTEALPSHAEVADPLYLFLCSWRWHEQHDASAGWELVQALRLGSQETRAIAAALLAKTEHTHLPARELRRTWNLPPALPLRTGEPDLKAPHRSLSKHRLHGLQVIENCLSCNVRKEHWFCQLSAPSLKLLDAGSRLTIYPSGSLLFVEGQASRGAYVLCAGRAKLSTTSREGKVLILRMAEAGEVLGLSAAIAGQPYELTAETTGPCEVNFLERETLVRLIENNGEIGLHASLALSREFQSAYRDIHDLVLARSSAGKLAKLLLSWTTSQEKRPADVEIRINSSLTHEEMAQMIGSSRETVTRLLSELKKRELIRLEGSTLVIRNRAALEAMTV